MFNEIIDIRIIQLNNSKERTEVESFLISNDLILEKDVEYTIALYALNEIIGTGSISGNVLKCIAIDPYYQGGKLSSKIVSLLINEQYYRGNTHLFVFTKPENVDIFIDMGFHMIVKIDNKVVLLENDPTGIKDYTKNLSKYKREGKIISAIVMNCNPFTIGHQYLIERASVNSDYVHVFIVWENKSFFPSEIRLNLAERGTEHLLNVKIHKGEDYIISNSTFPSYFLKESSDIVKTHALLDLKIFGLYIGPSLGINKRYIGEEPFCMVTREYNEVMKKVLPEYNIDVIEIPRLEKDKITISASRVRILMKEGSIKKLKGIVPKTTYDYLASIDKST